MMKTLDNESKPLGGAQYGPVRIFERKPIKSYPDGDKTKYCRQCGDFVAPKERIRGEQDCMDAEGPFMIHIDRITGECGHVVKEMSY